MTLQDEYQVELDAFCGPLDLLLYLIRRAEVDVTDIPIAVITDQYLRFLQEVDDIDIEAAGEFLVMAATLMEIKSRTLIPPEALPDAVGGEASPEAAGFTADPRFELVRQLLEYQRYRLAAEELHARRDAFSKMFPALPYRGAEKDEPPEPPELELEDAHVFDLYESYERIIAAIDFDRLGDHRVEVDDTPAAVYQTDLLDRLERAGGRLALHDAFEGQERVQRIGLFLAMLELVRLRRIVVNQEDLLSNIVIELNTDPDPVPADGEPPGSRSD
jgi:segregation and condensation protein A